MRCYSASRKKLFFLSAFHHKNITPIIGVSTEPPNLFILTELAERGSLYQVIHSRSIILSQSLILSIATDIAEGMAYLHSHNILHRDLKSPNILITIDWLAQITDFGESRVVSSAMTTGRGTPEWMAPEVTTMSNYTVKSDVYSFGIMLWELVARKLPFSEFAKSDIISAVKEKVRPTIPLNCTPLYKELIIQCWDSDPNTRPLFGEILPLLKAQVVSPTKEEVK